MRSSRAIALALILSASFAPVSASYDYDTDKKNADLHNFLIKAEKDGPKLLTHTGKNVTFQYPETWKLRDPKITLEVNDLIPAPNAEMIDQMKIVPIIDPVTKDIWSKTSLFVAVTKPRWTPTLELIEEKFTKNTDYNPDSTTIESDYLISSMMGTPVVTDDTFLGMPAKRFSLDVSGNFDGTIHWESIYATKDGLIYGVDIRVLAAGKDKGMKVFNDIVANAKLVSTSSASSSSSATSRSSSSVKKSSSSAKSSSSEARSSRRNSSSSKKSSSSSSNKSSSSSSSTSRFSRRG